MMLKSGNTPNTVKDADKEKVSYKVFKWRHQGDSETKIVVLSYLLNFYFQYVEDNLGVMSVGFLLSSPDDAVIWRGPKKNGETWSNTYLQFVVMLLYL